MLPCALLRKLLTRPKMPPVQPTGMPTMSPGALPELRLQLSASEGELDPRKPGLDATLWYAEPPWPADMQVFELAAERIGPVRRP